MIDQKTFLSKIRCGNAFDLSIARGTWRSYRHVPVEGKVVLDIGAHIGTYAVLAALLGAERVIAVEPLPRNEALFRVNAKPFKNIVFHEAAAVDKTWTGSHVLLRSDASNGKNTNYGHNTVEHFARLVEPGYFRVRTVLFEDLMKEHKPFAVKMDCEGSEFYLLDGFKFPKSTRYVFGEIHFHKKAWRDKWPEIKKGMAAQGFVIDTSRTRDSIIAGSTNGHGLLTWSR